MDAEAIKNQIENHLSTLEEAFSDFNDTFIQVMSDIQLELDQLDELEG